MKRVMYSRISLWRWVRGCILVLAPCRVSTDGIWRLGVERGGCTPEMARVIVCARRAKRQGEGSSAVKKARRRDDRAPKKLQHRLKPLDSHVWRVRASIILLIVHARTVTLRLVAA